METNNKKYKVIILIYTIIIIILAGIIVCHLIKEDNKPSNDITSSVATLYFYEYDQSSYSYDDDNIQLSQIEYDSKNYYSSKNTSNINSDILIGQYACINEDCAVAYFDRINSHDVFLYYDFEKCYLGDESFIFNDRYVFIKDGANSKISLFDIKNGNTLGNYDAYFTFDDTYIPVISNNKWGVIKLDNGSLTTVIPLEYDMVGKYEDNSIFVVTSNGTDYLYDINSKKTITTISGSITSYNDTFVTIKTIDSENENDYEYSIYNYKLNSYIEKNLDYAVIRDGLISFVNSDNNLMFAKTDGTIINKEPIPLLQKNNNYQSYFLQCSDTYAGDFPYLLKNTSDKITVYINDDGNTNEIITKKYTIDINTGATTYDGLINIDDVNDIKY